MTDSHSRRQPSGKISRRELLVDGLAAVGIGTAGALLRNYLHERSRKARVFIAKAGSYEADLVSPIAAGLRSLGIGPNEIRGKRILLKPNFVETQRGTIHICTRPEVIFAAVEVFRKLGAAAVLVGEGSGHCRDTDRVLDEADMAEALVENKTPFVDLNNDDLVVKPNAGGPRVEGVPPSNRGQDARDTGMLSERGRDARDTTIAAGRPWRRAWPWVVANALAGPALGVACYQWALAVAPTGIVLAIVATTPLVVIPFTMVLDGERPTVRSLVGGAVAVLGAAALACK